MSSRHRIVDDPPATRPRHNCSDAEASERLMPLRASEHRGATGDHGIGFGRSPSRAGWVVGMTRRRVTFVLMFVLVAALLVILATFGPSTFGRPGCYHQSVHYCATGQGTP